jgi:hypothetical protein
MSHAYHGPYVTLTLPEIKRVYNAIRFSRDAEARSLIAKCEAALNADSKFRRP